MKEIVVIQLGQCGNMVATEFWKKMADEHGLDPEGTYHSDSALQLEGINVFFKETDNGTRYRPRVVLVELETGVMDTVRSSSHGQMFDANSFVFGQNGSQNNWAKGHYTEGAELIDSVLDCVHHEAQSCDALQGFLVIHSLGGGTGSGMGTLLISKLKEAYPDQVIATFSVFPSTLVSDTVVEPYNATLAINQLIENADLVFCFDNEALYDICFRSLKLTTPTYGDLNHLAATTMVGLTAPLRFSMAQPNVFGATLREMAYNLVPRPRMHFVTPTLAPLYARGGAEYEPMSYAELVPQVVDPCNGMVAVDPRQGHYLACRALFRGDVPGSEMDEMMLAFQNKNPSYFSPLVPDNIKLDLLEFSAAGMANSAIFAFNNTAIKELFRRISKQFTELFKRRAFLHWYTGEGMDDMEFSGAQSNMDDLIAEYEELEAAGRALIDAR